MGCVCFKASAIEDSRETPIDGVVTRKYSSNERIQGPPSRRSEFFTRKDSGRGRDMGVVSIEKQGNGSFRSRNSDSMEKRRERQRPRVGMVVPKAIEGECVAAGWPPWLTSVAGEAIRGWIPRRADAFEKLNKIGQGTYSNVYRARDLENGKIVALKKVRFDNYEPESVRFMAREINILRRLDHPNIIKLEGLVTSRMSCSLYLVFEYMSHDLAGLVARPGLKFTEPQVKCFMQQLLRGLDHCHSRHILHRDIKGSNLLIDDNGILKIADFGLASILNPNKKHQLTSRVVTLWYRPPELLLGATDYGVAVDLWSTGCILAELYAGKPIMPGRTEVEQLHKIFKLCGSPSEDYWTKVKLPHTTIFKPQQPYKRCVTDAFKDFPAPTLNLIDILLSIDPADRGTAASALKNEFFSTKPLACDPSSLPKYPPSKELDAKLRDEAARRQGAMGSKIQRIGQVKKRPVESKAVPAPDANAELAISLQKRQTKAISQSMSEKFSLQREELASGFPIDPPRQIPDNVDGDEDSQKQKCNRASHSGPLLHRNTWSKSQKTEDDGSNLPISLDLSNVSGMVMPRSSLSNHEIDRNALLHEVTNADGRLAGYGNGVPNSTQICDQGHQTQVFSVSHRKEDMISGDKDKTYKGYGSKGTKIHYSGSLLIPSSNINQILKDHDRQIQEAVRRSRLDKAKVWKSQTEVNEILSRPYG